MPMKIFRRIQETFPLPPFLNDEHVHNSLAEIPQLPMDEPFLTVPRCSWTMAKKSKDGAKMPQTIAHRGFKAKHPENTLGAFKGAVLAGADAIETDIHLSKDGVVVLSHDATLKRCFGTNQKIIDCDWNYLSTLKTIAEPHESLPRLTDLLDFLASPGNESIWLLLDIKLDNDVDDVMRLIAKAITETLPHPNKPWNQRIVLGCWAAKYLPYCREYLPTFPITYIGFSISYARQFLSIPYVSFNMLFGALMGPFGPSFIREAQSLGRPVYAWTVNQDVMMRWCIDRQLDGVITDDPKRFREVCEDWKNGERDINIPWRAWLHIAWLNSLVVVFGVILWWKFGGRGDRKWIKKGEASIEKVAEAEANGSIDSGSHHD